MAFKYLDYIESISQVKSMSDLQNIFYSAIKDIGISNFGYTCLNPYKKNWFVSNPPFPVINSSKEWVKKYIENDYVKKDCAVRYCLEYRRVVNREHVFESQNISEDERKVYLEAAEHGLRYGLIIPAFGPGKSIAGLRVSMFTQRDTDDLQEEWLPALHSIVTCQTYWIDCIGMDEPDALLTPRQIECLAWSMEGLSSAETAQKLGIRTDTVIKHIRAAIKRLGVNNRVQAIIEAVRLGILRP